MSYVLPESSFSMYLSPDFTTVPEKLWLSEDAAAAPLSDAPAAGALFCEFGVCDWSGVCEEGGCWAAGGVSGVGVGCVCGVCCDGGVSGVGACWACGVV